MHLTGAVGHNSGATVHLDKLDTSHAMWVMLGDCEAFFPEAGVIVDLHDGDVITFNATNQHHCLMGVPMAALESAWMPDYIVISLYTNGKQISELKREREKTKGLTSEEVGEKKRKLSEYEGERLDNVVRNNAFLRDLGLGT